jgi:superfamily II DNA or RNA helicase
MTSTSPQRTRSIFRPPSAPRFALWPTISADALRPVREPVAWLAQPGPARSVAELLPAFRLGAVGVAAGDWIPPTWLLPHQQDAVLRLSRALEVFGGALLADAVGLGKSYAALAVATRYRDSVFVVPAAIRAQWQTLLHRHRSCGELVTHEALSRGAHVRPAGLLVVDEAHRFRNPATRRYDALARQIRAAHVLLLTATPVVNRAADVVRLVRLFLADNGLAALGLPSLEAAAENGETDRLIHALLPLVVARSPHAAAVDALLPAANDAPVIRLPAVDPALLPEIIGLLETLRFPSFGKEAAALLRQHLAVRLASSAEALRASLLRHRTYLDRAVAAARRGERLSRAAARALFGPDESPQLSLELRPTPPVVIDSSVWDAERARLAALVQSLDRSSANPKLVALSEILRSRAGRKTLVFTAARATAAAIAEGLAWRHVAVVSSRRARIASGPLAVGEAFALFAPRAQQLPRPVPAARVDILVATDLASEGLNLQDADGVIHYDLPWTSLRLEQRLGRIARLGSPYRTVTTWWFAPPVELERILELTRLIARKARLQTALGVPRTALVGRARVSAGILEPRERFVRGDRQPCNGHAVVLGPPSTCCVIRWSGNRGDVWELASPGDGAPMRIAEHGLGQRALPRDPPPESLAAIRALLRDRLCAAASPDRHPDARRLARRILIAARAAARRRDQGNLSLLDEALARLRAGVAIGAHRDLGDALTDGRAGALRRWIQRHPVRHPGLAHPTVQASILAVPERS